MNSLRIRLILSHIIPLLITVPLVGVALVYILETQVLLANIAGELQRQAMLIAETTTQNVDIWYNTDQAQIFAKRISSQLNTKVMLIDSKGSLLASSDASDLSHLGEVLAVPGLDKALNGKISQLSHYLQPENSEVADIFVPVTGPDQKIIGVIRLTSVQERFQQLRSLIAWVLGGGLLLGVILGWWLAVSLQRSLQRTTQAISQLAESQQAPPLPEQGPTELRLLVRAFNALVERLHTLEESRRRLLANLVHEIGRPLGALQSAIQALQSGADQDAKLRVELLTGMDGEIKRLNRLLDDLAHLHGQVLGIQELNIQPVALSEWLPGVLVPWREAIQAKGIHWHTEIPENLPVFRIDPDRMAQAIGNLLSNAVKYTPPGKAITVKVDIHSPAKGQPHELPNTKPILLLQVGNTGPVIPLEEQKRIFVPFYRGRSTNRFPQGMGLGLTIARDLVMAHGGELEVESTQTAGTRFTIRITQLDEDES